MSVISRGVHNAFRNSIRTFSIVLILGLSTGLALTMVVAHQAVGNRINTVKSSIGNIINISPAGARGFQGGGNPLTDAQMTQVKSVPHVTAVTETLQDRLDSTQTNLQSSIQAGQLGRRFNGGAAGGADTGGTFTPPVFVTGVNSVSDQSLPGGGKVNVTSGKVFDPKFDANVAIVGNELASKNSLNVGSTFQAYGTTFTVAAIYDAGNTFSNSGLILPLPTVQRLSQQTGDISSAVVQVDSIANLDSTVTAIQQTLGSAADVVSQQDTASNALTPLEGIQNISLISVIGAVVAGAVIILLTMLMIVRERRREIGVLKAIGASNFKVTAQFMAESVTLTVMGAILGLGVGILGANPVTQALASSATNSGSGGGGGLGRGLGGGVARVFGAGNFGGGLRNLQASVGWSILAFGLGAAIIIAIVGSAIPAWLIAKVRPAEVMRGE